jgi:hypothetical protein
VIFTGVALSKINPEWEHDVPNEHGPNEAALAGAAFGATRVRATTLPVMRFLVTVDVVSNTIHTAE